ncbi:GrdB-related putative oxidoreductase, partial [Enterococcus faecalis]
DYRNFGEMVPHLASKFNAAGLPAIAAMAEQNPAVSLYYQQVPIVKMPKKGGMGLNNCFKQMTQLVMAKANGKDSKQL